MKRIKIPMSILMFLLPIGALCADPPREDDPQDLFPSVVLEIEDLSVEKIDAGLPREAELAAFERETPLPAPGEIRIREPAVDSLLPGVEQAAPDEKTFFTSALFGAGFESNLLAEISFFRLGLQPVIKLFFEYENTDGFAYRQIGLGHSERRDRFAGSIKYQSDAFSIAAEAGFREREQGLQEQTAYFSAINQFSHFNAAFSARASDILTLAFAGHGAVTGFTVTGAVHPAYPADYPPTELLAGGELRGDCAWPDIRAGLAVAYEYRNIPGNADFLSHRFRATADGSFEISDRLGGEAALGVFSSSRIPYLFPFRLSVRAVPCDWFTLSAGGGYRVRENNLAGLLPDFTFADFPDELPDNHGWFATAGAQISFENAFLLVVEASLSGNACYPVLDRTADPVTGLFPLRFDRGVDALAVDCRAKLPLFAWLSVNGLARFDLPLGAGLHTLAALGGELIAEETNGAFGLQVTLTFKTGFTSVWEFPYLDASAFVRVLDNLKFVIEGLDLLQPLLGGPRFSPAPYVSPGIRARFKIQISL
jgi:hypothetical protein